MTEPRTWLSRYAGDDPVQRKEGRQGSGRQESKPRSCSCKASCKYERKQDIAVRWNAWNRSQIECKSWYCHFSYVIGPWLQLDQFSLSLWDVQSWIWWCGDRKRVLTKHWLSWFPSGQISKLGITSLKYRVRLCLWSSDGSVHRECLESSTVTLTIDDENSQYVGSNKLSARKCSFLSGIYFPDM